MASFEGKVALVSGGSRGIGLATARVLAQRGARVVLFARDAARLRDEAARIPDAMACAGDVRRDADCARAVADTLAAHGRLDVLVHGAGVIFRDRPLEATTIEEWDATFDTNVKGAFLLCRHALPALRQSRGNVVLVSSYVGLVGFAGAAAYAASKAALVNLARSIALDHARDGVRCNAVCPGSVATDMIFAAWQAQPDPVAAARAWADKHPLGRIATPDEVARAIAFLACDDAAFVTGAALPVDGGITAG